MDRRLTTIVAADIAGFSRLTGLDEEGTLAAQRAHRAELVDPLIERHGGRIANTAGDSLLIEFPSAVESVRCVVAVQEGMAERNETVSEDRRILYRVGINVGDVVDQDGDLLGDGVNIAARLEALAPPGGIVVSRTVRDQIRDREEVDLADLGDVAVKNIARPVRAFQVLREGEAVVRLPRRPRRRLWIAAAAVVLVALLAGAGWWYTQRPDFTPANTANFLYPLPEKPSIAVLAFDNLSGDPSQEYIADGFSEDITSVLAGIPDLFVIARNSAFSYKGKPTRVQTIAEELGVRYVLEGSLQRDGDKLRVTAQLIDAVNGRHVWTQKYDRQFNDLFAVKDDVVRKIATSLLSELVTGDDYWVVARQIKTLDAWLLQIESQKLWREASKESGIKGLVVSEKALSIEPDSSFLHSQNAWWHVRFARRRWSESADASLKMALGQAERALELSSENPDAYVVLAYIYSIMDDLDTALKYSKIAIQLAPSDAGMIGIYAIYHQKI